MPSLLESTHALLDQQISAGLSLREIADGSGGKVNYEWLKKLRAGKIDDPGVNRIQMLNQCLMALVADGRKRKRAF